MTGVLQSVLSSGCLCITVFRLLGLSQVKQVVRNYFLNVYQEMDYLFPELSWSDVIPK